MMWFRPISHIQRATWLSCQHLVHFLASSLDALLLYNWHCEACESSHGFRPIYDRFEQGHIAITIPGMVYRKRLYVKLGNARRCTLRSAVESVKFNAEFSIQTALRSACNDIDLNGNSSSRNRLHGAASAIVLTLHPSC